MMKRKKLYKILIAFLLSISLSLYAPVSHLRQESQAAVTEVVVLSAATLLVMYMAAVGVNYIFNGMSASEAKTYIGNQWETWKTQTGANPNITPNGGWKWGKLGQIIIGAGLGTAFGTFTEWVLQQNNITEDNTVTQVQGGAGSYIASNGLEVFRVNITSSQIAPGVYDGEMYTYSDLSEYLGNVPSNANPHISINTASSDRYGNRLILGIVNSAGGTDSINLYENQNINAQNSCYEAVPLITTDNVIFWQCRKMDDTLYILKRSGNLVINPSRWYEEVAGQSYIDIKTGEVEIPILDGVSADDAMVIDNPFTTVTQDEDGVPIPNTDAQVWEKAIEQVLENTSADTVYNPTYEIIENYGDTVTINSTTYDIPLTNEEEDIITGVEQPAWADFRSEDVPGFVNDIITYFRENNIWSDLKHKFPFSLPYDAYLIGTAFFDTSYDVMDELPTAGSTRRLVKSSSAPIYQINVPTWDNGSYTLTLDFSLLDPWRPLFRAAAGILFTVLLITGV